MSGNVIVTMIPEQALESTIISAMPLDILAKVFARALNTWDSPPVYLIGISDNLALLVGRQIAGYGISPTPPPPAIADTPDLDQPH